MHVDDFLNWFDDRSIQVDDSLIDPHKSFKELKKAYSKMEMLSDFSLDS